MIELVGNAATIEQLTKGVELSAILASWNKDLDTFRKMRAKYLLYP